MGSAALLREVVESGQDFEWYPSTPEIIESVYKDMRDYFGKSTGLSILDCGAGDGRVLKSFNELYDQELAHDEYRGKLFNQLYAIEKSRPLLDSYDSSIFVVGTDFDSESLLDKKVSALFCNPPYKEYLSWMEKIVLTSNACVAYLVVPSRWKTQPNILNAIEMRRAKTEVLGSFSFDVPEADRRARANVDIVRISYAPKNQYQFTKMEGSVYTDPFSVWFKQHFEPNIGSAASSSGSTADSKEGLKSTVSHEIALGGHLADVLEQLYVKEMMRLEETYKGLSRLDPGLLETLDVDLKKVMGSLKLKIDNTRSKYWRELFDNLDKITSRLTSGSRERFLRLITESVNVDFSASNVYAVVSHACKVANEYYDEQLIETYERVIEKANVALYRSNKKLFIDGGWRYFQNKEENTHLYLENRLITHRVGGIHNEDFGSWKAVNGLTESAAVYIGDLITVANNLGFTSLNSVRDFEWSSGAKHAFMYRDAVTGKENALFEVKAFLNGNLHIKLNSRFALRLNVEFGRLKSWLSSPQNAADELGVDIEDAVLAFNSNLRLPYKKVTALLSNGL